MELIGWLIVIGVVVFIIYTQKPEWINKILDFFKSKQPVKADDFKERER